MLHCKLEDRADKIRRGEQARQDSARHQEQQELLQAQPFTDYNYYNGAYIYAAGLAPNYVYDGWWKDDYVDEDWWSYDDWYNFAHTSNDPWA